MGRSIEVRLSDAQYAQLSAEAEASGQKFFEYCRAKLTIAAPPTTRTTTLIVPAVHRAPVQPAPADDRISRIEDAVARLTQYVLADKQEPTEPQSEQPQAAAPFDVDSIVNEQFSEAEAQGLTQHVPDVNQEVMNAAGVRPLSRRPVPFSPQTAPRHLAGL